MLRVSSISSIDQNEVVGLHVPLFVRLVHPVEPIIWGRCLAVPTDNYPPIAVLKVLHDLTDSVFNPIGSFVSWIEGAGKISCQLPVPQLEDFIGRAFVVVSSRTPVQA